MIKILGNIYYISVICKVSFLVDVGFICSCFFVFCDLCVNNNDVFVNEKVGKIFWVRFKVFLVKELFIEVIFKMFCLFEFLVCIVDWDEFWYLLFVFFNIEYMDWINLKLCYFVIIVI